MGCRGRFGGPGPSSTLPPVVHLSMRPVPSRTSSPLCTEELSKRVYLLTSYVSICPLLAHQAEATGAFCRRCPTSRASGMRLRMRSRPLEEILQSQPRSLTSS